MIYLDYSANTPADERVLARFCAVERRCPGNANSHHQAGLDAKAEIDHATQTIARLLRDEMGKGVWVDPFAGVKSPATITNDLNPERPTDYHMDALAFLKTFADNSVDGVLYDPPYSQRQVKECYDGIQGGLKWDGRTTFWSETKNEAARILRPGGKVICFGWNSMGLGAKRGFTMQRILLVPHGGTRNDTICTVEVKEEQK